MIAAEEKSVLPRTLAEFLAWEPEDGYKYEWNDGEIIKFENMNRKILYLINRLYKVFYKTNAFQNGDLLLAEQDVLVSGIQLRRPDLAYFTIKQINDSLGDDEQIPEFVIEIISTNDDLEKVEEKLIEYFKAGVRVVWHVMPRNKRVYVYTTSKTVKICEDEDICSASPVLEGFEISANDLFTINPPIPM